ncbi:hypothetical protein PMV56_09325 [Enterococcus avium]|nr:MULTISPECIES: hypothetical protein [Enterococcus]MBU5368201.1 hypothetical protein [Enterococcus avium]MDB1727861.1 hypothetical protein [Enterococcus avium]MDB1736590.1 hypothetical protein [Enterococcus avium]MDT2443566.1 hypothetical protein [Enterococcus avium]MDT2473826.1 hypothetical protein [Enterococcus avium]
MSVFLSDNTQPERSFQLDKLYFKTTVIPNIDETTTQALEEMVPLYISLI